jgi:DNA polymerase (family X)
MDRAEVVARLREIAALLELHGGDRFRVRAFARGARSLEATQESLDALIATGHLMDLPGIGVGLAKQITELHTTGCSELLATLRRGLPSGVLELSQVAGVGLHALREFFELGIDSVDALRQAALDGRLRDRKGFGEEREKKILEAIARYEGKRPKILLADGLRLAQSLVADLASIVDVETIDCAGALRRAVEVTDEVVLVVTSPSPAVATSRILALPRWARGERIGPTACRLRLADGKRVTIVCCHRSERAAVLVQQTGTDGHVEKLRRRALERSMVLGDQALRPLGAAPLKQQHEHELYSSLGLAFIPPEIREGGDEIEAAAAGPISLVEQDEIQGYVHCHSTWSDGQHSIEEMALAAAARGATFITITDHSHNAHYAGGLDVERLLRQWDEIDEVQERVGIRIFKGTEADILVDGAIDWPDRILERLDVLIVSIHNRYRQNEEAMTQRLLRAMRAPVFKIWGHPLGRLVMARPPIACRVEQVLDALATARGAIEINGDPRRLDLEPSWSREACRRGIPFVLSVDAHSTPELDNLQYAIGLARRAGLGPSDVLNTRDATTFGRLVRPMG